MPNVSSFGAQTDNAVVSGTVTDRQMIIPEIPPQGLMSVGPRVTPNFVKPREWNAQTTYHFFDAVRDTAGNAYVATKPVVPAGTPLTDEDYWFLWADPDTRFDDLNETVKTFNQRITQNTNDIATKAPIKHASEETIYGIGNAAVYGHVRLATDGTPATSDANDGIAATPKMVSAVDEKKSVMIAFGDSFGDASGEWADLLAKSLGLNLDNFCKGGATWPFSEKLNECIEKYASIDKGKISFAIAYGGINTTIYNKLTATPIIEFINKFNESFPGVPLYIAPLNNCNPYNTNFPNAYKNTINSAPEVYQGLRNAECKFALLENSWLFCTGDNDLWQDDKLHPNAKGSKVIANNILSAMHGNTIYQGLKKIGTAIDDEKIIELSPGYITRDGIYIPSLKITNTSNKRIYFKRNGFPEPTFPNHILYYDRNTNNSTYVKKEDLTFNIYADSTNPQYILSFPNLTVDSGHEIIVPSQFISF